MLTQNRAMTTIYSVRKRTLFFTPKNRKRVKSMKTVHLAPIDINR